MDYTIRVRLIKYFRPSGMEGFKKKIGDKLPCRSRISPEDELTIFTKKVQCNRDDLKRVFGENVKSLNTTANFSIQYTADYGDTLLGVVDVWEEPDLSMDIFSKKG